MDILTAKHQHIYIVLSSESIEQLEFWKENVELLNVRHLIDHNTFSKIVYNDASSYGYAGYEVNTINGVVQGICTQEECMRSSAWR